MTEKPPKSGAARRQFIFDSAKMVCGVGMLGLGLGLYAKQSKALPALALRPPGALPEEDFLGACIRCGLCVRDCPYNTLELARPEQPVATGTPFFKARNIPCEMCEDIPCIKACPTGALDHSLTDINKSRMGIAGTASATADLGGRPRLFFTWSTSTNTSPAFDASCEEDSAASSTTRHA